MIVVKYREKIIKSYPFTYVNLGTETYEKIEEVLLPKRVHGTLSPIFITKKFSGRVEYRWEVADDVAVDFQPDSTSPIFIVTLTGNPPVKKR